MKEAQCLTSLCDATLTPFTLSSQNTLHYCILAHVTHSTSFPMLCANQASIIYIPPYYYYYYYYYYY